MDNNIQIGTTFRGDAALDHSWLPWYEDRKPLILITKNFKKLNEDFPMLLTSATNDVLVHVTVTLLGKVLEPNVPSYKEIREVLGTLTPKQKEKIIIRVDPFFIFNNLNASIKDGYGPLQQVELFDSFLVFCLKQGFKRYRISFLDLYTHVKTRMKKVVGEDFFQQLIKNYDENSIHAFSGIRQALWDFLNQLFKNRIEELELNYFDFSFECCGEPDILSVPCVSQKELSYFGIQMALPPAYNREECSCLGNKFELLNDTFQCEHKCLYCYMPTRPEEEEK